MLYILGWKINEDNSDEDYIILFREMVDFNFSTCYDYLGYEYNSLKVEAARFSPN